MNKSLSNSSNKDKNKSLSKDNLNKKDNEVIKPLIISGFILSLSSIFLLIYVINNKFG